MDKAESSLNYLGKFKNGTDYKVTEAADNRNQLKRSNPSEQEILEPSRSASRRNSNLTVSAPGKPQKDKDAAKAADTQAKTHKTDEQELVLNEEESPTPMEENRLNNKDLDYNKFRAETEGDNNNNNESKGDILKKLRSPPAELKEEDDERTKAEISHMQKLLEDQMKIDREFALLQDAQPIFQLSHKYAEGSDSPTWRKKCIKNRTLKLVVSSTEDQDE